MYVVNNTSILYTNNKFPVREQFGNVHCTCAGNFEVVDDHSFSIECHSDAPLVVGEPVKT